ncbi:hypothetical protein WN48_07014 [Eufriesea mexicana]|uniref:Uncharacterized protein n=1 Tax=Eufriesea mexicana TaxID=516756 RepID=A0A310SNJ4_9HYME|nr:PREDICTED: uncharacterized protein PF11_0213 [Eufriesea mexicana]OAD62662.1 hypothetical protein WN48_07014 [Eufriesea mexicana]
MLLTLFRLTMIVSLLISAVRVHVNSEKLSLIPSEEDEAVAQSHRQSDTFLKSVYDEDKDLVQRRQSNKDSGYDSRIRRGSVNSVENRFTRSGNGVLAHKMAKDVLKSPKTQDTIRKLSRVSSPKGSFRAAAKVPGVTKGGSRVAEEKRHHGARHRGRRKKKKRHHRKFRKQQPGLLKRGSSKRTSDSKKDINAFAKGSDGRGHSMIKHNPVVIADKSRDKPTTLRSSSNITAVKVDDDDYVDFSSPMYTEPTVHLSQSKRLEKPAKLHGSEKMIEQLMRTTTKDPSKKSPGDQGVEYSDYYSDDEVLQDIAANKIPIQLAESKNPNDRFTRQALNFTSYRDNDLINRNLQHYYSNHDTRRKGLRYRGNTVNSLHNFQNYPTIERLPTLNRNSRHFRADYPSFNYATNYEPLEYRNENFDSSYPTSMAAVPEPLEGNSLPEQQNDLDASDPSKLDNEIQPVVEVQDPDQFNYQNQYETAPEHFQSSSSNEPQSLNVNEALEPRVPQFQSLNSYQQVETNLPETGSFDQSMMNQPRMDNMGILDPKEEDAEVRTQSSYTPIQLYDNQEEQQKEQQKEQALKNFLISQSKHSSPALNVPNAMDQPLGKILESLGINVNSGPTNFNQNPSFDENINRQVIPYSNTYDRSMEHAISPNYLKRKPNEDLTSYHENGNAKGSEYQTLRDKNGNNAREDYLRRQSIQNNGYNNNLTHLEENENPTHNVNISIAMHDTKEVANQILDTIMEELEELKEDKLKDNKKEGLPCRLSGSWSTAQAGVKLDMRVVNRTIIVTLSDLASPRLHESLLNGTWNVSGHVPFKRGSPFTLIATNNNTNSIAVFVGACRVCQGIDTIAGVWSVARQPNGCKDFQVSTSVFNDIFRKTKWSSLKEKQGSNTTENSTIKHKKRKS